MSVMTSLALPAYRTLPVVPAIPAHPVVEGAYCICSECQRNIACAQAISSTV